MQNHYENLDAKIVHLQQLNTERACLRDAYVRHLCEIGEDTPFYVIFDATPSKTMYGEDESVRVLLENLDIKAYDSSVRYQDSIPIGTLDHIQLFLKQPAYEKLQGYLKFGKRRTYIGRVITYRRNGRRVGESGQSEIDLSIQVFKFAPIDQLLKKAQKIVNAIVRCDKSDTDKLQRLLFDFEYSTKMFKSWETLFVDTTETTLAEAKERYHELLKQQASLETPINTSDSFRKSNMDLTLEDLLYAEATKYRDALITELGNDPREALIALTKAHRVLKQMEATKHLED